MTGGGTPRSGRGGRAKSGKPRPGTGGYGKRRLEGKGPTPPAHMRPGHPAQRRAAAAAKAEDESQRARGPAARAGRTAASRDGAVGAPGAGASGTGPSSRAGGAGLTGARAGATRARGAGDAPEMVAGRNAVVEALQAGVPATALYAGPRDGGDREREAITLAAEAGIPMIEVGRAELDRITGGSIHQGLALRIKPYDYALPEDLVEAARAAGAAPIIVALDGVTDPRNLGAIVRSAAAFGGHGVVIPSRRSVRVTAGAWKASAGALARVPVALAPNLARTLAAYQQAGLFVVGLDASGQVDVADLEIATEPLVLVIGSEGRGLSRIVAERCDLLARIPIATESLNAGVAAGIVLHEVARRRRASL